MSELYIVDQYQQYNRNHCTRCLQSVNKHLQISYTLFYSWSHSRIIHTVLMYIPSLVRIMGYKFTLSLLGVQIPLFLHPSCWRRGHVYLCNKCNGSVSYVFSHVLLSSGSLLLHLILSSLCLYRATTDCVQWWGCCHALVVVTPAAPTPGFLTTITNSHAAFQAFKGSQKSNPQVTV